MKSSSGIDIREESIEILTEYSTIPISFLVESIADVDAPKLPGGSFTELKQNPAYLKDYDSEPGHHPTEWPDRFDLSNWGIFVAREAAGLVGGIAVAYGSPEIDMLDGRTDLAVVWDLRVSTEARRRGVGAALIAKAESWAGDRNCRELEVETQNINVPACRFYQDRGFRLKRIDRYAYPGFPREVQIVWSKPIFPTSQ